MSRPDQAILAGRSVLVVEDEFFMAEDMAVALAAHGATVVGPVASCEDALSLLAGPAHIDLAVLDINLRGQPAFVLADALDARGVPLVFASGYTREAVPERFAHVPLWEKPFEAASLVKALPQLQRRT